MHEKWIVPDCYTERDMRQSLESAVSLVSGSLFQVGIRQSVSASRHQTVCQQVGIRESLESAVSFVSRSLFQVGIRQSVSASRHTAERVSK